MATAQQHEQSIINALRVTDPQLDTALGTTVRKLISAVALELSGYTTDTDATTTLYALESVSGAELDYLVGQFGFSRQVATAARGTITVSRDNADSFMPIEYGTQFYVGSTAVSDAIIFQTTSYQELGEGVTSADISVIAASTGSIGNVAANTIKYSAGYTGYIACTNKLPTSGGRDAETDEELRKRFLATVFRNEAGTRDQYLGLALAHAAVGRAKLIGQESHYYEVEQVEAGYVVKLLAYRIAREVETYYPRKVWVRNTDTTELFGAGEYDFALNPDTGVTTVQFNPVEAIDEVGPVGNGVSIFTLSHIPYNPATTVTYERVTSGGQPESISATGLTISGNKLEVNLSAGGDFAYGDAIIVHYVYMPIEIGEYVTVEFDYVSKRVRDSLRACELFVDGNTAQPAVDIQYVDFDKEINDDNIDTWTRADGTSPEIGSLYIPLSRQPVIGSQNNRISVGTSQSLEENIDFKYIYDGTNSGNGTAGVDGIELMGEMTTDGFECASKEITLADETPLSIPYYYNSVPDAVQSLIDAQSVVTMDTIVHAAARRRVGIFLTVMYSTFPRDTIADSIESAVVAWANRLDYGAAVQFSDIETVAANLGGVDNVRVSTLADAGGKTIASNGAYYAYGIVEYARDGETIIGQKDSDFVLDENEVLDVMWVEIYGRAQSNW